MKRLLLCSILVLTACAQPGAPTPAPPPGPSPTASMTGTWIGPVTNNVSGTGRLRLTLTQTGGAVTGELAVTPTGSGSDFISRGALSGTVSGETVNLATSGSGFSYTLSGRVSGSVYEGTVSALSGSQNDSGQFTLTRQ